MKVQRVIVTPLVAVSTTMAPPVLLRDLLPEKIELVMIAWAALKFWLAISMAPPPAAPETEVLLVNVQLVTVSTPVPPLVIK